MSPEYEIYYSHTHTSMVTEAQFEHDQANHRNCCCCWNHLVFLTTVICFTNHKSFPQLKQVIATAISLTYIYVCGHAIKWPCNEYSQVRTPSSQSGFCTLIYIVLDVRKPVFGGLQAIKAQTSLPIRAVWSAPLLFTFWKVSYQNLLQVKFQFSS